MNVQIPIEDRANMISQMLVVSPHLCTLVVYSRELALCLKQKPSVTLSSLNHLHLYLGLIHEMVDPVALAIAFPNISYLSTGKRYLIMDIKLGHVVLDLIKALPYLRLLTFNDRNFSTKGYTDPFDDNPLVQMLQNSEQLRSGDCFVKVYSDRHLVIWL
jgi:hypothetical protein